MEQKNNQPVKNTCKCKQNLGISFLSCPITSYLSKIFYMNWKYRLFIGKAVHCICKKKYYLEHACILNLKK